jgi:hypothetical protein
MRTIACQYQSILGTTRFELCKLVFVAFEGQVDVRYGPETHAGANTARAAQHDVMATRAEDLQASRSKSVNGSQKVLADRCHGIIVSTNGESVSQNLQLHC